MAYPVEGDGVLSFLRRWNRIGDTYVEGFMELNAGRLNAKDGLELGTVSLIPELHPGDEYPPSETGNIQNEFDRQRILSSNNRQALANWMAQVFFEDYKKSVK